MRWPQYLTHDCFAAHLPLADRILMAKYLGPDWGNLTIIEGTHKLLQLLEAQNASHS